MVAQHSSIVTGAVLTAELAVGKISPMRPVAQCSFSEVDNFSLALAVYISDIASVASVLGSFGSPFFMHVTGDPRGNSFRDATLLAQ